MFKTSQGLKKGGVFSPERMNTIAKKKRFANRHNTLVWMP